MIVDELFWLTESFYQEIDLNKSKYAWENLRIVCAKKNIFFRKSNKGCGKHSNASAGNIANWDAFRSWEQTFIKGFCCLRWGIRGECLSGKASFPMIVIVDSWAQSAIWLWNRQRRKWSFFLWNLKILIRNLMLLFFAFAS
jgi:hypothetical protein